MDRQLVIAAATLGAILAAAACGKKESSAPGGPLEVNGLKAPSSFTSVGDDAERAAALFTEMAKVIQHPRCANCHPKSGGPTQGDDMRPHEPPMVRGSGFGPPGMECNTCHGTENVEFASMAGSIPGAEPWHLPPESMGWQSSSISELCAQLKDQQKNGGRSLEDLVEHNSRDHLVNWAWNPGEGRSPAPGDQATFGALTAAWVEAGAHCPAG